MSLVFLASAFGVLTTILWLMIGWRAMRAHERIADALSSDLVRQRHAVLEAAQKERNSEESSFRDFLAADPLAKHLDANEQMRRYTEWKQKKSE